MKILIIGDIFGIAGKEMIMRHLPFLKQQLSLDFVIANAENVSDGKGMSYRDYQDLKDFGVDYFTMGNHTFKNKEIFKYIDSLNNIVRPANFKENNLPGVGFITIKYKDKKILLFNLLGKELMGQIVDSPFFIADQILEFNDYDLSILDFHAETTSEKKALSFYLKDKVDIFFGTHTHIQTADEIITDEGQAYISDVGMTGVVDSAIGVEYQDVIDKLKYNKYSTFKQKTNGNLIINSILITLYDNTLKPYQIERINIKDKN